jgi:hypothetical protein
MLSSGSPGELLKIVSTWFERDKNLSFNPGKLIKQLAELEQEGWIRN